VIPIPIPISPPDNPATFEEYLSHLPTPDDSLFQSIKLHYDCFAIIDLMTAFDLEYSDLHVQLINVSNGSAFDS
jgi:hypothetical protein